MIHTYNINGMHCSSCVTKVKSELLKLGDITNAEVQLNAPQATITMQKHISVNTLQEAVRKAGNNYLITEDNTAMPADNITKEMSPASYYPIFLIFLFIALPATIIEFNQPGVQWMHWTNNFMAGFFLVFSFFKLLNLRAFADGYSTYDIVAKHSRLYAYTYPFIELGLGLALLAGIAPLTVNIITLTVMSISTIGVAQSLMQKKQFQCACLGTVISLPLSKVTLVEDLLMVVMSAVTIIKLIN